MRGDHVARSDSAAPRVASVAVHVSPEFPRQLAPFPQGQPQAQQMPLPLRLGEILVVRTGMENRVIVDEQQITLLEIDVKTEAG